MISNASMFQSMHKPSIIDISNSARLNERLEQRPEFAGPVEVLRMPLHAEAEAAARVLECFDDAVGRRRRRDEPLADILRRLVVAAVHGAGVRLLEPLAQRSFEQAVGSQP